MRVLDIEQKQMQPFGINEKYVLQLHVITSDTCQKHHFSGKLDSELGSTLSSVRIRANVIEPR